MTSKAQQALLWQAAAQSQALAAIVAPTLGPCGELLMLRAPSGYLVASGSGARVLQAVRTTHPFSRVLCAAAVAHQTRFGDGSTSFILAAAAVLQRLPRLASTHNANLPLLLSHAAPAMLSDLVRACGVSLAAQHGDHRDVLRIAVAACSFAPSACAVFANLAQGIGLAASVRRSDWPAIALLGMPGQPLAASHLAHGLACSASTALGASTARAHLPADAVPCVLALQPVSLADLHVCCKAGAAVILLAGAAARDLPERVIQAAATLDVTLLCLHEPAEVAQLCAAYSLYPLGSAAALTDLPMLCLSWINAQHVLIAEDAGDSNERTRAYTVVLQAPTQPLVDEYASAWRRYLRVLASSGSWISAGAAFELALLRQLSRASTPPVLADPRAVTVVSALLQAVPAALQRSVVQQRAHLPSSTPSCLRLLASSQPHVEFPAHVKLGSESFEARAALYHSVLSTVLQLVRVDAIVPCRRLVGVAAASRRRVGVALDDSDSDDA